MILDEVARAPFVTSDSDDGGVQTTTVLDTETINLAADARATVAATRDRALLCRLAPSSLTWSAGDTDAHQC